MLRDAGFSAEEAALRVRKYDMATIAELFQLGILSMDEAEYTRDQLRGGDA